MERKQNGHVYGIQNDPMPQNEIQKAIIKSQIQERKYISKRYTEDINQ